MKGFSRLSPKLVLAIACMALSGCLMDDQSDNENTAPMLTGAPPPAIPVDEAFSFKPSATDPDGDELTFSIENPPLWASFDPVTGELSGTPTLGDIGFYSDIAISVSDGEATASQMFSVEVAQALPGSVTLQWIPPTENTDGSALLDLIAYKIRYGRTRGDYPNKIRIDNAGITTYLVENLSQGDYFFVITAVNAQRVESQFSNVVKVSVN